MLNFEGFKFEDVHMASIYADPMMCDGSGRSLENKADDSIRPVSSSNFYNFPPLIFLLVLIERIIPKPSWIDSLINYIKSF